MLERAHCDLNQYYQEEENLILCVGYGTEGMTPCHRNSNCTCVSSSGTLCGGYAGHKEIEVDGTKLFIVKCRADTKCDEWDGDYCFRYKKEGT